MPPTPQHPINERAHGKFKMRLTLRRRLNAALLAGAAALLLIGTIGHRAAYRSQLSDLRRRVDELSEKVQHLPREGGEGGSTPLLKQDAPEDRETALAGSVHSLPTLPPRFLGGGRCAGWRYVDVRHVDGSVRRYYCRTNAPPSEVSRFVSSIVDDARDARILALDNQGAL